MFRWLAEEGEIADPPMARMRPRRLPERPVPIFTDGQLRVLLAACAGRDFEARRDTAVIRAFLDTGAAGRAVTPRCIRAKMVP